MKKQYTKQIYPVNESVKPENLPFIQKSPLLQRVQYIKEQCRGKKVLHLGCANYPYTEASIENGTNLHFDLMDIASELYGFDYDQPGIDIFEQHGIKNIYRADAENLQDVPLNETFDVIIAGEIIEHLSNPGLFLRGIQRFMNADTKLIVTTINAYGGFRFLVYGFKGKSGWNEPVHLDHVAYYSYSTLGLMARRANLKVNKFFFYDVGIEHRSFLNWRQRLANDICVRISPLWCDGVIAECSLPHSPLAKRPIINNV